MIKLFNYGRVATMFSEENINTIGIKVLQILHGRRTDNQVLYLGNIEYRAIMAFDCGRLYEREKDTFAGVLIIRVAMDNYCALGDRVGDGYVSIPAYEYDKFLDQRHTLNEARTIMDGGIQPSEEQFSGNFLPNFKILMEEFRRKSLAVEFFLSKISETEPKIWEEMENYTEKGMNDGK